MWHHTSSLDLTMWTQMEVLFPSILCTIHTIFDGFLGHLSAEAQNLEGMFYVRIMPCSSICTAALDWQTRKTTLRSWISIMSSSESNPACFQCGEIPLQEG